MSDMVNHPAHYGGADNPYETIKRAREIHDKLVESVPMHASPLEDQAMADYTHGKGWVRVYARPELHGNFEGFVQYRKTLAGECQ